MGKLSKSKAMLGIAFVVITWGLVWPIYKVALNYTPPFLFAGMRTLLGGILLSLVLFPKRKEIQWKKTWPIYVISAFFNIMIFNGVQTYGLQFLPSGLFSVIVYLQPVLVVLLAWLWLKESLSIIKIVGMVIGFLGVVAVSFEGISGQVSFIWYNTRFHYRFRLGDWNRLCEKNKRIGQWLMACSDPKHNRGNRIKRNWAYC